MKLDYQIRAVQLDLARQMETKSFIRNYIDFIAANHYNTLFLYLEWRVRTKVFDIGAETGYSAKDLREIVDYAASRGINVIPGLATLGHAELLLSMPKYGSYSELRNDVMGRFGASKHDMCPSLPEVRKFLEAYIKEVCAIFKETPYLHVGGDEVYNIGYCELCKEKAKDFSGEQQIYLEHFKFIAGVVKKCGKRPILWDDMFEYYTDIVKDFPRDYIMATWQYQENASFCQGHFFNLAMMDFFKEYDRLGFDCLVAPGDFTWANPATFTAYGAKYKPMGGLLTSWEHGLSLVYRYFPAVAATGQLWGGAASNPESAMILGIKQLFGVEDEAFINAVKGFSLIAQRVPNTSIGAMTTFAYFGPDNTKSANYRTMISVLAPYIDKMKDTLAKLVLTDIVAALSMDLLAERSRIACWNAINGMEGESLDEIAAEVKQEVSDYISFLEQGRRKCDSVKLRKYLDTWLANLKEVKTSVRNKGMLRCLLACPDQYSAPSFEIYMTVRGKETLVAKGCWKEQSCPFFERTFFIPKNAEVESIRIVNSGFGGEGICYLRAVTGKGEFVPAGITAVSGVVEHPEFLLDSNVNYAFFGFRDVRSQFTDRAKGKVISSVSLSMKKAEPLF